MFIGECLSYQRRQWHPTPVVLPGKSHGRRSLVGCSPWGRYKSDKTEQLHFHFSLSCIGGGNGNLLQNSCLENPRDREAWWAAVYGVTQSWTRLKRLSSSSSFVLLGRIKPFYWGPSEEGWRAGGQLHLMPVTWLVSPQLHSCWKYFLYSWVSLCNAATWIQVGC